MTPGARLLSTIDILSEVLCKISSSNIPADTILNKWYRNNRYAGSKDRKEISDDKILELAIDSGANECISKEQIHEIHCEKSEIYEVKKKKYK